jgi:organic hydroperoxide reductase OsmC/OhrA
LKTHSYATFVRWTSAGGDGTKTYRSYARDHTIGAHGKPEIPASSDPSFRGDARRYNPEELLVASLSSCHMLWYLHLCSINGVTVTEYSDNASGTLEETGDSGEFVEAVLRPRVTISEAMHQTKALELHHEAHRRCFIARSVKFPVRVEPAIDATTQPFGAGRPEL